MVLAQVEGPQLTIGNGDTAGAELPIVCPTCDGILEVDGLDGIQAGDAIRSFCPECARNVEVTAPPGIETTRDGGVDRVDRTVVSEFPTQQTTGST